LSSGSREQLCNPPVMGFGVRFSLCWFIGAFFLCLSPYLWGKVRDPSAGSLLSPCYAGLLMFFNFAVSFDFGCCSLAQELSFVDCYLPYFRQWLITCLLSALCLSSLCLLNVHMEISSLLFPTCLVRLQHPAPSAACSFSVLCLLFRCFLWC
jgi:hypothetical protein